MGLFGGSETRHFRLPSQLLLVLVLLLLSYVAGYDATSGA